jgi:hypothetical protein
MENSYSKCKNVKSKRNPKIRCPNTATHGEYCGIHHKHPQPWTPKLKEPGSPKKANKKEIQETAANRIRKWYKWNIGRYQLTRRGPAYYARSIAVNDADFFSTDPIADISGFMFFSYKDTKKHVHAFDIRSIATLIEKATDFKAVENPFTRDIIPLLVVQQVQAVVKNLKAHKIATEWAPLEPSTPIQQYRMKIVDLFNMIDELNYYSSPEWFLNLTAEQHRKFYRQLYDIWTHRANLSEAQKNLIVPSHRQILFRQSPFVVGTFPLERLQKVNMTTIRIMITSAADKNDRILGAMYIISTLTLVCDEAKEAYPWLYESVVTTEDLGNSLHYNHNFPRLPTLFGVGGWITDILNLGVPQPPPLMLENTD